MDEFVRKPKQPIAEDSPSKVQQVSAPASSVVDEPQIKKTKFSFKIPTPKTKKQWIITVVTILALLSLAGFAIYWFIFRNTSTPPVVVQQQPQQPIETGPVPIYSVTSGRETDATTNSRPVYAVQIENSPEARPQSGLINADIVSEAIAEGGITRFNAIYHDNIPANLGPIRSLRPYYINWFRPYDAAIVHAGGSGEALSDIKTLGLKDIDHGNSSGVFRRVSNRYAPHNLYSTGQQILDLMTQRGYKSDVSSSLPRKKAEPSQTPSAKNISLNISRALYNANFTYDSASNTYLRAQGGSAHVDADTKQQIAPNVVVVPVMGRRTHPDRVHTVYDSIGSGKVYVFQDGAVTEGTWTKPSREAQWELKDASGNIIKLNPGQTWFTMIESADRVSFTP